MTLKSLINSHAETVFLQEGHFAEEVTHYPEGEGEGVSRTAVVEREEPRVQASTGREIEQPLKLWVSDSITCLPTDQWDIGGQRFQTESVSLSQMGLLEVAVTRVDKQWQGEGSSGVL